MKYIDFLQAQGFEGFKTMGELMDGVRTQIGAVAKPGWWLLYEQLS